MNNSDNKLIAALNFVQQQRLNWSNEITTLMSFAIVICVGVWSYVLPKFIEGSGNRPAFFLTGAAISSIILGLWRIYSRYLDNEIAHLYPEIIYYESSLCISAGCGTSGYLNRNIPNIDKILLSKENYSPEHKSALLMELAKIKRMGDRGHYKIDLIVMILIFCLFLVGLFSMWFVRNSISSINFIYYISCIFGIAVGFIFTVLALTIFQKNPSV